MSQPNPGEISGILTRVNQLGTATEKVFSRLYNSINRRSRLKEAQEQVQRYQRRSQQLRHIVHKREEEIERLNGILGSISEGVIMQDTEGRLVHMNTAARELLGSQKSFWESELSNLFDNYRDIVTLDSEITPLNAPTRFQVNNKILGAQVAAVGDSKGNRLGTMIVLRDVTLDALSDRLKDQFVTAISHELRTPMTIIKGMSEVVLGQPAEAPANRRFLETIGRNVDILDRMIVELLDISEMSADAFSIRRDMLHLEDLLWNVIRGVAPELSRGKLDITLMAKNTEQLYITGDDERLRWALGHILQNSIRYTEAGGHIIVTTRLDEDQRIAIQIVDTGVGISDKDLPHIFERFYRGEPRNAEGKLLDPRGLGQGLFIARKVTEAHQGYLNVRSTAHTGSIFTLVLPATPPEAG